MTIFVNVLANPIEIEEIFEDLDVDIVDIETNPIAEVVMDKSKRSANQDPPIPDNVLGIPLRNKNGWRMCFYVCIPRGK